MNEPRDRDDLRAVPPGAHCDGAGTTFVVLSTIATSVAVRVFDAEARPVRTVRLEKLSEARFGTRVNGVLAGALYKFVLDDDEVPDPYARFLPFGVHGPARVTAPGGCGAPLPRLAPLHQWSIYELHVGTFSPSGTFRGAMGRLDALVDLGVTAIELMPVTAFEGARGWGYDSVALYAPHASYGSVEDLRELVRAAHARGLAVILDVVYNHFGPSGNYLARYAPEYFTSKVKTPWGDAPNFGWLPMRRLVLDNALHWFDEVGFDALRLDATHAIHDDSDPHILRELTGLAHERGRLVVFEDGRNEPDVIRVLGADGVWADDLHHQLHVLLTGERDGYYAAYEPTVEALANAIDRGWVFSGQPYAPWDGRRRGKSCEGLDRERLVTCTQNHDQIGNRALGERLSALVSTDAYCAVTALALFLPTTPLLFMGQEWACSSPFLYFTDHGGDLGAAVSRGRREEFQSFAAFADPATRERIPDPEARSTFEASRLKWNEREQPDHARVLDLHRTMLRLRQTDEVLSRPLRRRGGLETRVHGDSLEVIRRSDSGATRTLIINLGRASRSFPLPPGAEVLLRSGVSRAHEADATLAPSGFFLLASAR